MTPANLLVLVSGPNCQRQSRQRFLESVTVRPGSPGPHFTTAKLAMPWLQAGPQAQVSQCKCQRSAFTRGSHHPIPCLAELPTALSQQYPQGPPFLKPWPAQQTLKVSSATLFPPKSLPFPWTTLPGLSLLQWVLSAPLYLPPATSW